MADAWVPLLEVVGYCLSSLTGLRTVPKRTETCSKRRLRRDCVFPFGKRYRGRSQGRYGLVGNEPSSSNSFPAVARRASLMAGFRPLNTTSTTLRT